MSVTMMVDQDVQRVAKEEGVAPAFIEKGVADGSIVILKNKAHEWCRPVGVGRGLKTKVNVNLGTSPDRVDYDMELEKVRLSMELGADTVMDLSTGGEVRDLRIRVLKESKIPVGTVPIYEAVCRLARGGKALLEMTKESLL
jgi:phosphomethylpyrimidine synthase